MAEQTGWVKEALAHTRILAKQIGPRGATTDGERQAAGYARNKLEEFGLDDVRLEPFVGATSAWIYLAAAFSLAAWGMVFGMLLGALGGIVAVAFHLLAAWLVYQELVLQDSPLRRVLGLWRGESQNVVGVIPPAGPVERQVVLFAYLDTAQAGFFWQGPVRRRTWGCLMPLALMGLPFNALMFLLGALTGWGLFYLAVTPFLLFQTVTVVALLRAGRADYPPGANNNGAGVATVLTLAERLGKSPLQRTQVWILLSGCRESGCDGLRAFLDAHGSALQNALFVGVERVGVGEYPVCLTGEGGLRPLLYHPEALVLVERVAQSHPELEIEAEVHPRRQTEVGLATRRGFKGLTLTVLPPGEESLLYWRQMDDTIEVIEPQALEQAQALAWALLQTVDVAV